MQYVPNYPNLDDMLVKPVIPNVEMPKYEKGKSPYELMESQSEYLKNTVPALEKLAQSAQDTAKSAQSLADTLIKMLFLLVNTQKFHLRFQLLQ